MRKLLLFLSAAAFCLVSSSAFAAIYKTNLGTLGGNESEALDINNKGMVVGWSETANGYVRAFSWTKAAGMKALPLLSGGKLSVAFDINENGNILGICDNAAGEIHFVVWIAGIINDTKVKITTDYYLNGFLNNNHQGMEGFKEHASINNHGQVACSVYQEPTDNNKVYIWSKTTGPIDVLFDKHDSIAFSGPYPTYINDFGTIISCTAANWTVYIKPLDTNADGRGDVWVKVAADGTNSLIKDYGAGGVIDEPAGINKSGIAAMGDTGADWGYANLVNTNTSATTALTYPSWAIGAWPESISDSGAVAGAFGASDFGSRACMWDNRVPFAFTKTIVSNAVSICNFRQAVGRMKTSTGYQHALFCDKRYLMKDMGTLGGKNSVAYKINDAEQAIGSAEISNGNRHAILWTIAEPFVVNVDIRPGYSPNYVSLRSTYVYVAVLSQYLLSARNLATSSIRFAGAAPVSYSDRDVNGDGRIDRVYAFRVANTTLAATTTSAVLTGTMSSGRKIWGKDSVRVTN